MEETDVEEIGNLDVCNEQIACSRYHESDLNLLTILKIDT